MTQFHVQTLARFSTKRAIARLQPSKGWRASFAVGYLAVIQHARPSRIHRTRQGRELNLPTGEPGVQQMQLAHHRL